MTCHELFTNRTRGPGSALFSVNNFQGLLLHTEWATYPLDSSHVDTENPWKSMKIHHVIWSWFSHWNMALSASSFFGMWEAGDVQPAMFTAGYIHFIPLPFFGGTWPRSAKRHLFLTARCLCMQCLPRSLGVSTSFCSINLLVGGLEHFLFSHLLGIWSSQLTFIFFRRGRSTTNQI